MVVSDLLSLPDNTSLNGYTLPDGTNLIDYLSKISPDLNVPGLMVKDIKVYHLNNPDEGVFTTEIIEVKKEEPPQQTPIHPETVAAIASPDKRELRLRQVIGGLFSFVLAFTILAFTSVVVMVCIERKELPSATLAGIIILPTMMVTWYYMGIINRERRDILSAVVGDKINSSVIADVISAVKNRR